MSETWKNLAAGQLQEIKKWRAMGFTQGQIARKMGIRHQLVSAGFKRLKELDA